jgi:hypothetical protein
MKRTTIGVKPLFIDLNSPPPSELRFSIQLMLQSTNHGDPMVDFDPCNIPPEDVDPDKYLVLHPLVRRAR